MKPIPFYSIALVSIVFSLAACQTVAPVAADLGMVAGEDKNIGEHSIPENAAYIGVAQGYRFLGGVSLEDKLKLWVIPYNGNNARQVAPQGPFIIAIQAWDLNRAGSRSIQLAPNTSYLRLSNGEIVKPMGYRVITKTAGAHCHPAGYPTHANDELLASGTDPAEFLIKNSSPCIEIFFDTPMVDPAKSFSWVMPAITDTDANKVFPSREISFVKHYGR